MKVLVLSVTAGEGHNAMGRAVVNYLKETGHEGKMIDYFKGIDKTRSKFANEIYFWTLKHFPNISHHSYMKIQSRDVTREPSKYNIFSLMLNSKKAIENVKKTIDEYQPDCIFCTHLYTATLMSRFKEQGMYTNIKTFFTVSDYVTHPYTENATHIDYLLTPNHDFDDLLLFMGYKKEQLLPFGIVADMKFSRPLDKELTREKLGLEKNKTTVLIMNGGQGFGNSLKLIKMLDELEEEFQMILVNGRNKDMQEKVDNYINTKAKHKVLNLGFVKNVDELMSASDVMLGKIGGAGIAEAFNKSLPIICTGLPPFQEYDNLLYLREKNIVIHSENIEQTKRIVKELVSDPKKLDYLKENVKEIARPNATKDLVEFMEKITNE